MILFFFTLVPLCIVSYIFMFQFFFIQCCYFLQANIAADVSSFSPFTITVAPLCRPGQVHIYNVARQETAKVICELESNPNDLNFTWKFNNTIAESIDLPASLIAVDRAKSIAHYTPMVEQVRRLYFLLYSLLSHKNVLLYFFFLFIVR